MELLSIGRPQPSTAGLNVWTKRTDDRPLGEGDRLIMAVQADQDAYLTVMAVSSDGQVTVVFPNSETRDSAVAKGRIYTLFGDDSRLRVNVGKAVDSPRLVFFLSSKPIELDSIASASDIPWLAIPATAKTELKALKEKFQAAALDSEFKRFLVALTDVGKQAFEVQPAMVLAQKPSPRPLLKKLPSPVESTSPETVTGVQGWKTEPLK